MNGLNPTLNFAINGRRALADELGFSWGSTSLKLKDMFSQGMGILSQVIAGKQGTQVSVGANGTLSPVNPQPVYGSSQYYQQNPYQYQTQVAQIPVSGAGQQAVGAASGIVDGIASSFGISTSTLGLLTAGAAALYLMQPRGRR